MFLLSTFDGWFDGFFFPSRLRTAINVLGDSIGAGIIHHLSKKQLEDDDSKAVESPQQNGIENSGEINLAYKQ